MIFVASRWPDPAIMAAKQSERVARASSNVPRVSARRCFGGRAVADAGHEAFAV